MHKKPLASLLIVWILTGILVGVMADELRSENISPKFRNTIGMEIVYDGEQPLKGCAKGSNRKTTLRVGSFAPNPWGLYDMHGNVWEWCRDWYTKEYSKNSVINPRGPFTGSAKSLRGGAWFSKGSMLRSSYLRKEIPDFRSHVVGFRVAKTP